MEEQKKIKRYERFYFDTVEGGDAFMEVDWNDAACQDDMLKIKIEKGNEIVVRREDLETLLLALTKDPSRYIRSTYRKMGVKYIPVPNSEYKKYKDWKKRGQIK